MDLEQRIKAKQKCSKIIDIENIEAVENKEITSLEDITESDIIDLVETETIEEIIDDEIEKVKEQEAIQEIQKENDKDEEFKLTKEDAYEIKKFLVNIKNLQIEYKNTLYKNMIEILKETHFIKKSQSANNKTTYGLMFMAGVAFGMADTKWMPFAKGIYELFSTILNRG